MRVKGGGYAPSATDVKAADVYYDWIREQIAAHATARGLVAIQPDEAHQRMPISINLALRQTVT